MDLPNPALAIYRYPVTVSPDTSLLEVLAKMNQIHGSQCALSNESKITDLNNYESSHNSQIHKINNCAVIVENEHLRGIITERDVVNWVAKGQNLAVPVGEVMTKKMITLTESEFKDVFVALSILRQNQIRHLPIVDDRGKLIGIVTAETIRQVLQPLNLLTMRRIGDVMTTQVIHASPSTLVLDLARLMAQNQVSCIVIANLLNLSLTSQQPIPIGIVTERDILQMQILGLDMSNIRAETVMSQPLFCMRPEHSLWVAHQEMQRRLVRRLVVTGKQGELVGVITQTNIMRALDPVEMYSVIETLQEVVNKQTIQLVTVNKQLELQAEEVRQALQKEQEINQLKSQFISMISHEFTSPLTGIIGLADLLKIQENKLTESKKNQYLNCISDSSKRMLDLVKNLLLISKSEQINLDFYPLPLNLNLFGQQLIGEMQIYDSNQHDFIFTYYGEENCQAFFDEKVLRHIFVNLFSNAIKYSPIKTQINFQIFLENEQGRAIFKIQDEGIGIPLKSQSRLFELFYRADNVDNTPGTGIGLAIVKKYIDLLKGEIIVESTVEVGTTFTVLLPLHK
ncbi:MAG TPA: CBS domain-containing protein [Leptolyngbyaceae cyanobacterium]